MSAPFEIIAAPFTIYLAPVGEAFPNVDANPAGNWVKLGTSGNKNYSEEGVSISHPQTVEYVRALGSLGPVKAFRTEEDLIVSFSLMDLSLEQYRNVLNNNSLNPVAAAAGTPGYRAVAIARGATMTQRAMLIRGPSPYADAMNLQYELPRVVNVGEPEILGKKGEPTLLLCEFRGIEDPDFAEGVFGRIVAQTALSA